MCKEDDFTVFSVPGGKMAEIVDYAVEHNLPLSNLTLDDYREIAAKLGIPTFVGSLCASMRRSAARGRTNTAQIVED